MIELPFDDNRMYDPYLEKYMLEVWKPSITKKHDDDGVLMIVGPTGTGKSNLALWILDGMYDDVMISQVALNQQAFMKGLDIAKNSNRGNRYLLYDEVDLNKRNAMTKWNKDIIELYYRIRGLNIFHVWCYPSANMIDGEFIRERVNNLILCYDKSTTHPRRYYMFNKKRLFELFEGKKKMHIERLISAAPKQAYYQGWFKQYDGKLKEPYLELKNIRMGDAVDSFVKKHKKLLDNKVVNTEVIL
jgi:hypothetical protein